MRCLPLSFVSPSVVRLAGLVLASTIAACASADPADPDAEAPTIRTSRNSSQAAAPSHADLPAEVRALLDLGYLVRIVVDLEVLNTTSRSAMPPDAAIATQKANFDVVANGTFYGGTDPVGPIVRDGRLDTGGYAICFERGGVARLRNGAIVVARTCGGTAAQVAKAFSATADNAVEEAMGGGALLLEGGQVVASEDLRDRQNFKQGKGGIEAAQMRKTTHSLMGTRNGVAYHVWAWNKSGVELQRELHAAGFDAVVMFDGGGAGFYDDGQTRSTARSPALLGLGLTVR